MSQTTIVPAWAFHASIGTAAEAPAVFDNDDVTIGVVTRASLPTLDEAWRVTGCYLVLDPASPREFITPIYVGYTEDLVQRATTHFAQRPDAHRVVLIRSAGRPFDTGSATYLERVLYEALQERRQVWLTNKATPSGCRTLSANRAVRINQMVVPAVLAVLRLVGVNPDSRGVHASRENMVTVAQCDAPGPGLVVNGNNPAGERRAMRVTDRDIEILRFIADHDGATYSDLVAVSDTSYEALRQRLPRLVSAGFVVKGGYAVTREQVFALTDLGRVLLTDKTSRSPVHPAA